MTTLYFIRHGAYRNPNDILPLRTPRVPLAQKGIDDITHLAQDFTDKDIDVIYTSPILRCLQSAKIFQEILKTDLVVSELITELLSPKYQGMDFTKFNKLTEGEFLSENKSHLKSGGETRTEVYARVNKLVEQILTKHSGKKVVIFSHADPLMNYLSTVLGFEYSKQVFAEKKLKYIPMGGAFKLTFDDTTHRFLSYTTLNY